VALAPFWLLLPGFEEVSDRDCGIGAVAGDIVGSFGCSGRWEEGCSRSLGSLCEVSEASALDKVFWIVEIM
jgi:hypothetical protein